MKTKKIKVPENTEVKISQEDNRVIIEFVPEKVEFNPKDGDFLACRLIDGNVGIFIFNEKGNGMCHYYADMGGICIDMILHYSYKNDKDVRFATDSQKQQLIDTLAKQGLRWNAEEKKVEEIRWSWKGYWVVGTDNEATYYDNENGKFDKDCYNTGNYFKTEDQAKEAAKLVRETLLKFQETL